MQYCFVCQSEVSFPHICPKLYGRADTHKFEAYLRKGLSEVRNEPDSSYVKCATCGWVINKKDLDDVGFCPASKTINLDLTKSVYTGLTDGKMLCPTCNTPMKKVFTSKDGQNTKYFCSKCHPLSEK